MNNTEQFLKTALAENGMPIGAGFGPHYEPIPGAPRGLTPRNAMTIIRGTTFLDPATKNALVEAVDCIETDSSLRQNDVFDAVETIDRIREELSEREPGSKRLRRFVDSIAAISQPAADAVRGIEKVQALLAV